MMQCEIIRDLLPLYHDGACSGASRAAVEAHIEGCEACRALLAEMDAPLPLVSGPPALRMGEAKRLPAARMKEAKRRLVRRITLSVVAVVAAMGLLVAGGAALYTRFEEVYSLRYSDQLVREVAQGEDRVEIRLGVKRYAHVSCLFRRLTIDGEARDIACIVLSQSRLRQYLDWSADGPEMIALGAGVFISRGGLGYEAYYGYEYEPELWNPNWAYTGHVTEIYYWDTYDGLAMMTSWPEEEFSQSLDLYGKLLWREGQ